MRDWSLKSGVVIATAKVAIKARLSFFNGTHQLQYCYSTYYVYYTVTQHGL